MLSVRPFQNTLRLCYANKLSASAVRCKPINQCESTSRFPIENRLARDKRLLTQLRDRFNTSAPESGLLRARKFNEILRCAVAADLRLINGKEHVRWRT